MANLVKEIGRPFKQFGNWMGNLLQGGENAAIPARAYLEPVPGYGKEAYNPFIQQGQEAYGQLHPEFLKLLTEPHAMLNTDVGAYEPSNYFKQIAPYLEQSTANAARAGGYYGSDADAFQRGQLVNTLLQGDIGNFLDRIASNRAQGIQGLEGAVGRGFQGAGNLADFLGNAAGNRANLEYAGKSQQGINQAQLIGDAIRAAAAAFGAYQGNKKPGEQPSGGQPGGGIGQGNLRDYETKPYNVGGYQPFGGRRFDQLGRGF